MINRKQIIGLIIMGILIASFVFFIPSINKAIAGHLLTEKPTKEPVDPYKETIQEFQAELQRTDLPLDARNLLESKLNLISMEATQRAEGLALQPTRPISPNITPRNIIGIRIPDGINNTPEAPFSQLVFTPLNSWRKTTPDHSYLVFAGHLTEDMQQGAVYVFQPDKHTFTLYVTPEHRGAVRAVAELGSTITQESSDGTVFYFDATMEQFVNAQGTPYPYTPTPFNSSQLTPIPYP